MTPEQREKIRAALKEATEWNWLDEESPPPCEAFNKIDAALATLDASLPVTEVTMEELQKRFEKWTPYYKTGAFMCLESLEDLFPHGLIIKDEKEKG